MVRRAGCLAAALAVVVAAPAVADTRALLDAPRARAIAVAGDDVVVGRVLARGAVTVDAVPITGGPSRRLLTLPGRRAGWGAQLQLAASDRAVGLIVGRHDRRENPRGWDVYAGPPAGPLQLAGTVRRPLRGAMAPMAIDADGARLLTTEIKLGTLRTSLRIFAPGAPPAAPAWRRPVRGTAALAGRLAAFVSGSRALTQDRVEVVDLASGATVTSIDVQPEDGAGWTTLDLAADGTLLASLDRGVVLVPPGGPERTIDPAGGVALPRFAGTQVAALMTQRSGAEAPMLLAPRRRLGPPTWRLRGFAAGARGVAWIANGCVLFADLAGPFSGEPPGGPCPRAEIGVDRAANLRPGRRLVVRVLCVAAAAASPCRGTLRAGRGDGRGRFAVPAGRARLVTVRTSRRLARRTREPRFFDGVPLRVRVRVEGGRAVRKVVHVTRARG